MISQWHSTNSGSGFGRHSCMIICLLLLGSLLSLGLAQASTSGNLCIPYTASEKVTLPISMMAIPSHSKMAA